MKLFLKRVLSVALAVCMAIGSAVALNAEKIGDLTASFAVKAAAATIVDSGKCGDNVTYTLDSDGLLKISGTGRMDNYTSWKTSPWKKASVISVVISEGVTNVGEHAFSGYSRLTGITIPDTVTSIGRYAFNVCSSLTSITIGNGVTSIGEHAFSECSSLTSITIPNSITSIGESAFFGCSSLTSITIPDGVTSIKKSAFSSCRSLMSITIPDSVTSIGYYAFEDCSSLTSITIPDSVTRIDRSAFEYVPNIVYSGTAGGSPWGARALNGYIEDGLVYEDSSKTKLLACPSSREGAVVIPNGVTSIGEYAFRDCSSLTSITIGNGVTSIGDDAFYECSNLTSITIPDSVTSIGEYTFHSCSSLTSVTIGNGVTRIGRDAFRDCSSLTSITIPDSVTSIDDDVFEGCKSLTSVTIPGSVTSIGERAFDDCVSLTSITIPDSVTSIGSCAFSNCSSLMDIIIPDGVTSIGDYAFSSCRSLTSITIPDSVTSIDDDVFEGCKSLTSVTIPGSVTRIGRDAFRDCSSLTSITIPNSVTSIGDGAFCGCSSLMDIIIPDGVTSTGFWAFSGCSSLTSVAIGNAVASIDNYAFRDCSSLTSITIPSGVTNIRYRAFSGCYKLTEVYILNPDCITEESSDDIFSSAATIYSHAGYGVEKYAKKCGFAFVPIHINENTATAKCTEEVTEAKCKYCDEMTLPVLIHDFTAENTDEKYLCEAATCYRPASYYVSCKDCGLSSKDLPSEKTFTYGEAVDHKGKWVVSSPATCTSTGYENEYCIYCDCYLGGRTIPTTDHTGGDPVEENITATCTDPGTCDSVVYCVVCGEELSRTQKELPALGHDIVKYDAEDATCTTPGHESYEACTRCEYSTYEETTPALGHTPDGGETTVVSPTCTEKGYTVYTCSVCGEKYNDTYVDALGHDWAEESVRVEPTCTEAGYTRRECTRCDVLKNIKWDAKYASSHPYSDNAEDEYTFSYPGAESIELVFNADTQFERNYDFLYIYDGSGNLVGKYSDNELSSRKVVINGDAFKLKLTSDGSVTRYGFEIESITVNAPASMDAEYTILPALGHDWDEGTVTDPTCTEQGYTKHNCTRCSETMCDTYVDPFGHDWDEGTVTDPTCTSQGYTKHRCTRCDSITYDTYTDPLGHDWSTEWTVDEPVTCTKNGSKSHHCTRCDAKNDVTVISCPGHDYGEFETVKEPTCTDKGSKKKVCANCNDTVYEDIPALGHDYASEWTVDKAATCTVDGSKSHHCSRCDGKSDVTVIPATGHAYGEFETVKEPTCTDKGSKKKVCANCNDTVYEDIPALGHNWATEWTVDVPATCTVDGSKSHHCSRCDGKSDITVIPATGHAYGEFETVKEPTCTDKGSKKKVCANCNDTVCEDIPALGHDYASEWTVDKAATCTVDGSKSHHCSRCDGKSDVTVIPATGHAYGEFETVKEPTCTDKGSKKKVCANCNDTVYEDIPALGHNWATEWTVDVPVTCTSDGSKSRHCLRCDAKTDVLSLTSSGHAFGEWVTEKAADCTKDGLETRKCATCGAVEKKVLEKFGHDYPEYTVTKATTVLCEGEERAECVRCGNVDVRVIPKIQIDTDSNKNYGLANFTVVNAQTKEPIKGANLFISTENDGENTFVTDENGKVGIVLPIGRQTVSAYADGCLTRNLKINIQSGTNEIPLIGLSSKKTYDVEVNHHLMTKEEIEEAGIDTDAPENNHVFKYEVTFEFEPEIDWLSIFYYMNGNGDILGGGSGGSGGGSGYGGAWYGDGGGKGHFRAKNEKTGEVVNVYPVSEYFYLIIRGEVRWLKEMFDVEMLVVNNSETDTLEDLAAELELPDGLSLATMKGEQQTLKKELENVAEGKTTSAHWYVRGDKAGSYEIAASLKGMVMPFEEEINDVFKAKNALQVWAGNALHLDFEVPSSAYYAKDYPIKITLTNVSDITLYNVSHYITGIEQSRVTYYSDGKVEKEIYMKKDTNIGEFVTEFNPGDKIVIELSVNIMFQSKLMEYRLNQLIGKVDQIEQLIKAFKAIKTGLDIADGLISAIGSASKAVDSFISSASAELAEKVTLARDLKSALVDFEMAYSKFENKTVDAAVKLTNSAVGASLKAFTQEPDEWLKKTSVKDIKKLISGVKTLGNSLSGQPSKAEIKKFNVFDSIRTLISAIPIVFTLKNVFLVEDEDNTTSIPWSCTVTQSGPEYFGVANLSRHLSNILIAGSADLIKGMLPSYIFLIPGANSALSAEDAKREIIAVEKEITRFKARSASGDVTYKAYVVRNTQTQSMMLRSVSALSDGFILSSDNDTARFENGVLTFTGDGMIEVTPADLSGGTLVVEDSDGNKYEYEMTVVAQHECTPDEREVIISPTADNDGFAVDCCSVCGDVINVELLSAKECTHSYGEWVEDIAAVCNAEGLRHRDCTLCGYSESEVTEPTDRHVPGEWIIDREATCTETGEKHTVCSVCGTVSETAAIEKIAHTMTAWTVKTAATCTAEGVSERSCTECSYAETKPIAKTAHTMTGWAVKTAATCTAEGVSERSCTECGYAETKPIAKTEHTSSGWIGISAATCTEDGERCMKCTVCGAVLKTETVPAHGHADADKNGKCDNCGESLTSSCKHICHSKNKLAQFFWKMIRLMYKLFKKHEFCDCGVRHW